MTVFNVMMDSSCYCASCGSTSSSLKRCSGCHSAYYCDTKCQHDHRPSHKKECKRIQRELAASAAANSNAGQNTQDGKDRRQAEAVSGRKGTSSCGGGKENGSSSRSSSEPHGEQEFDSIDFRLLAPPPKRADGVERCRTALVDAALKQGTGSTSTDEATTTTRNGISTFANRITGSATAVQ